MDIYGTAIQNGIPVYIKIGESGNPNPGPTGPTNPGPTGPTGPQPPIIIPPDNSNAMRFAFPGPSYPPGHTNYPGDPNNGHIEFRWDQGGGVIVSGEKWNEFITFIPDLPPYQSSAQGKIWMSSKRAAYQMKVKVEIPGEGVVFPESTLSTDFTLWFAIDRSTASDVQLKRMKDAKFSVWAEGMPANYSELYTFGLSSPCSQQTLV